MVAWSVTAASSAEGGRTVTWFGAVMKVTDGAAVVVGEADCDERDGGDAGLLSMMTCTRFDAIEAGDVEGDDEEEEDSDDNSDNEDAGKAVDIEVGRVDVGVDSRFNGRIPVDKSRSSSGSVEARAARGVRPRQRNGFSDACASGNASVADERTGDGGLEMKDGVAGGRVLDTPE